MLPVAQMHHVVHPYNVDGIPSRLAHQVAQQQTFCLLHQRQLPVRTSDSARADQGNSNATGTPYHLSETEYQLRRKTPNGTVDAGYDGNPTQLAFGPPASKHIILSTVPSTVDHCAKQPRAHLTCNDQAPTQCQHAIPGQLLDLHVHIQHPPADIYSSSLPPQADPSVDTVGVAALPENACRRVLGFPNTQSHVEYVQEDTLGNCPYVDQMPLDITTVPSGRIYPNLPPPSCRETGHVYTTFNSAKPSLPVWPRYASAEHSAGFHMTSGILQGSYGISQQGGAAGAFIGFTPAIDYGEQALLSARQAYAELLAYQHHIQRSQGQGLSNIDCAVGKSQLFPKPFLSVPKASKHTATARPPTWFGYSVHPRIQHLTHPKTSNLLQGASVSPYSAGQSWSTFSNRNPTELRPAIAHTNRSCPVSVAKTSLEILTHLCEQSGWRWAEGLVLGGCLQFALDQLETALEWFTRAAVLDASDVDTASYIAATLYCLGRHEEAEKTWLSIIHACPSALEAVEHLVGLLYKKKSSQAVHVINFVQDSLRIEGQPYHRSVPPNFPCDDDTCSPGYGSSGYAVPGCQNGRVLALIHAKGTMQYALRDVEQASRSFEEVVLISTGRCIDGIQELVNRIRHTLACSATHLPGEACAGGGARPLLLEPERARLTAKLVFPQDGELGGLRHVPAGGLKRAAIQTTSNSLLSLAKIFQDAMSGGASTPALFRRPAVIGDILSLYYLSLSLQDSPSTANNVGILLASVPPEACSEVNSSRAGACLPSAPGVPPGSGLALALSYYNYGLALDPKHVHLHTNLGSLLKDIGHLDLAIHMYEKAVACDGNFDIALTNLANAVKDRGRVSDAISYYKRAVCSNPNFAEAVCGLSTALNSVCDWRGRGGVVLKSGLYDRWHVDSHGMLFKASPQGGSGLTLKVVEIVQRQLEEAANWGQGTLRQDVIASLVAHLQRHNADLHTQSQDLENCLRSWSQRRWEGSRVLRLVERFARETMHRWYCDKYLSGLEASASSYMRIPLPQNLTIPTAPTVLPFHTFTCPLTAKDIRLISQRNASRISCSALRAPWLPTTVYPPPPPPSPQLRVGYVSSDFNNHPLAHLMQSVFGFHDKSKVRAICYATSPSDKSAHRLQIEREAPVFRDVSSWPSDKLVSQIVEDGVHVLVNLNGYTRGARNDVFAARPAPIQMSFMGFAGTLGAEWCDYVLADTIAIPPETLRPWRGNGHAEDLFKDGMDDAEGDWVYSENVIFCRDTFFCCDHAQSCDPEEYHLTWEEEQRRRWRMRKEIFPMMADDVVILGNFNQLYKIEPSTFRTWLRILSRVPNAVLWLLRFPELGEANLKRTAKAWAGSEVASRIIFTDVAPKNQHIARARVCDLFLDTPECNAHTTAADVLWSSTPLVTFPRYTYKMCSRMATSILKGALPKNAQGRMAAQELVASSDEEYELLAVRLASSLTYQNTDDYSTGVGRLADLRKLLWKSKWSCALFDTRRWVSDLEHAYQEAWRRWVVGDHGDIFL